MSSAGKNVRLEPGAHLGWEEEKKYKIQDGTGGEIWVSKPETHFRITRQPGAYPRLLTVQARIFSQEKKFLAFLEEHLLDENERQRRKTHYLPMIETLNNDLG